MDFILTIAASGDAFGDDPRVEVARLLDLAAHRLLHGDDVGLLHDLDGNRVGEFFLKESADLEPSL